MPDLELVATVEQVDLNTDLMTPPNAKTTRTISAAMPATRSPYSTAEAPPSSRKNLPHTHGQNQCTIAIARA